jgi:8-oxo-dGTP pyrophosphatase MutT (NUDIX family)
MEKIATTSCGCCVIRWVDAKPQVLLVRPFADRDAWGIPKGHVNEGELLVDCALRETREEAGIDATVIEPLSALDPVYVTYKKERKTVHAYLAVQSDPSQIPVCGDNENVDIRYFGFDELPNLHVYQRPLLAQLVERVTALGEEAFSAKETNE